MELTDRYPTLFALVDTPDATGVFEMLDTAPPFELVGRVHMVPAVGDAYLYLLEGDGRPLLPGGPLEPQEMPRQALARELLEEAGANPIDAELFGGWHLHQKADQPEAPHLPHPEAWTLVYAGDVERVSRPLIPGGTIPLTEVRVAPLSEVVGAFRAAGREDLAELYWLVDEQRRGLL